MELKWCVLAAIWTAVCVLCFHSYYLSFAAVDDNRVPAAFLEDEGSIGSAMGNLRSAGIDEHQKLKNLIENNKRYIEKFQEQAENVMGELKSYEANICPNGKENAKEVIISGTQCIAEAISDGVQAQVKTQINCSTVLAEYLANFTKMGMDFAMCAPDVECKKELLQKAEEVSEMNWKVVEQNMNHMWEMESTLKSVLDGCFTYIAVGINAARSQCGIDEPIDTSGWPSSDEENNVQERLARSVTPLPEPDESLEPVSSLNEFSTTDSIPYRDNITYSNGSDTNFTDYGYYTNYSYSESTYNEWNSTQNETSGYDDFFTNTTAFIDYEYYMNYSYSEPTYKEWNSTQNETSGYDDFFTNTTASIDYEYYTNYSYSEPTYKEWNSTQNETSDYDDFFTNTPTYGQNGTYSTAIYPTESYDGYSTSSPISAIAGYPTGSYATSTYRPIQSTIPPTSESSWSRWNTTTDISPSMDPYTRRTYTSRNYSPDWPEGSTAPYNPDESKYENSPRNDSYQEYYPTYQPPHRRRGPFYDKDGRPLPDSRHKNTDYGPPRSWNNGRNHHKPRPRQEPGFYDQEDYVDEYGPRKLGHRQPRNDTSEEFYATYPPPHWRRNYDKDDRPYPDSSYNNVDYDSPRSWNNGRKHPLPRPRQGPGFYDDVESQKDYNDDDFRPRGPGPKRGPKPWHGHRDYEKRPMLTTTDRTNSTETWEDSQY